MHVGIDFLALAFHVDDCILTGSLLELIAQYKQKLNEQYALTDLGPVHWLLGIKITCNYKACTISLSQSEYIKAILAHFSLVNAKPSPTPIIPGAIYLKKDSPTSPEKVVQMGRVPYYEAIGSLIYASVATHPDITFAVSTLSQFLDNLGKAHWEAVKWVFHYLAGTQELALTYRGEKHKLQGFTDTDGSSQKHHCAISSYAFLIDRGAVSWSSCKQKIVSLSTVETRMSRINGSMNPEPGSPNKRTLGPEECRSACRM
jgi:Reverse transcriptase (RNA-dependent DNA polymerase)